MTNEQLIEVWMQGRSEATKCNYVTYIARAELFSQELHKKRLIDLGQMELSLVMTRLCRSLNLNSKGTRIAMMRSFFKFLLISNVRHDDPSITLRIPACPNTLAERIMTHEQVGQLLVVAKDNREKMMVKVLYGAGLRVSEMVGMRCKDIRSRKNEIEETVWTLTVLGKGGRTETVRITEDLGAELAAWVKGRPLESFIFTYANGVGLYAIHTNVIRRALTRMGKAIGVPKITPHWLRHTHASEALRRGANVVLVQRSLRHSSLATTMRYCHLNPDEAASLYLPSL